jgi:arginase family enzyme
MSDHLITVHLDLDGAWPEGILKLPTVQARLSGPRLRFSAPAREIEEFYRAYGEQLGRFILYGSGDFHHLSALWLRRVHEPFVLISFDNHPDWDIRPPKWCCGSWLNRALEVPQLQRISVWGCGNFECWWPGQIFGNRRAEREGRLDVYPWSDNRSPGEQDRRGAIRQENWRSKFENFAENLRGTPVYVTIDMDCLRSDQAVTNWESGRFELSDLAWALAKLRSATRIVGGDICGAYSPPIYQRWKQRFAAGFDHPRLPDRAAEEIQRINRHAVESLWPSLAH